MSGGNSNRCPTCRRTVVNLADADTGLPVVADRKPLSKLGEALALVGGCDTFELRWVAGRFELAGRDQFRIRGTPPGSNRVDILVRHDCELAGQWPTMKSQLRDYVAPVEYGDKPPY